MEGRLAIISNGLLSLSICFLQNLVGRSVCPCVGGVNPSTTPSLKSHLMLEGQVIKVYFGWPWTPCILGTFQ